MKQLIIIFSLVILVACSKTDESDNAVVTEFEEIESILPKTEWKVNNLFINNEDYIGSVQNFSFIFKTDGIVEAKADSTSKSGTWIYRNSLENGEQLIIQFNDTSSLNKLSNQWEIISIRTSQVEFIDEEKNSDVTHLLSFNKS
ncbi:hypothetical protein [Aequorivita viscosa]|uniref:Lipocalin-like domain-containing protein n=1 Tax=Aequorivita viscosa TaxID=797419 RepID=A0A1M6JG29_9FLAO|nr:hypothetical protein [Aequorivita viscosa]SDX10728.1 hypothetical protein SAMN05216556_11743 [Aequorivita viscosa]SHJ45669.1 hypothetical protein SAMN04487908_11743 [Aequorivita viscosa]